MLYFSTFETIYEDTTTRFLFSHPVVYLQWATSWFGVLGKYFRRFTFGLFGFFQLTFVLSF